MTYQPADIRIVKLTKLIKALHEAGVVLDTNEVQSIIRGILNSAGVGDWVGVAERALSLGFAPHLVSQKRSQLGTWVASYPFDRRTEDVYVNGKPRKVYQYQVCDELDEAIRDYFRAK